MRNLFTASATTLLLSLFVSPPSIGQEKDDAKTKSTEQLKESIRSLEKAEQEAQQELKSLPEESRKRGEKYQLRQDESLKKIRNMMEELEARSNKLTTNPASRFYRPATPDTIDPEMGLPRHLWPNRSADKAVSAESSEISEEIMKIVKDLESLREERIRSLALA